MAESPKKIIILDPAKEDRRQWEAKRAGKEKARTTAVAMLLCQLCGAPISPDLLIFDKGEKRACSSCAKKP